MGVDLCPGNKETQSHQNKSIILQERKRILANLSTSAIVPFVVRVHRISPSSNIVLTTAHHRSVGMSVVIGWKRGSNRCSGNCNRRANKTNNINLKTRNVAATSIDPQPRRWTIYAPQQVVLEPTRDFSYTRAIMLFLRTSALKVMALSQIFVTAKVVSNDDSSLKMVLQTLPGRL